MAERIPLAARPRFAAKMLAVWRWHHMAAGEQLSVTVMPGEWPEDQPHEVRGCPVHESDQIGGPGAVMVLGQVGAVWRGAYQLAVLPLAGWQVQEIAVATAFLEVDAARRAKLWLHPDPATGETPMWEMPLPRAGGRP